MNTGREISIVVPVLNEEENIGPLVQGVRDALESWDREWELVLVDDGSEDATPALIMEAARNDSRIRLVSLARRYGQSTAMQAGFDHSHGDVVVTMDGDLQNDPRDIPAMVAELERGHDLVAGYRQKRKDHLIRRKVPSWVANRMIAWITGVAIRDNGCSLKAYRRSLLVRMRLYSDLHRFIPALAVGIAGARVSEIPVRHHARVRGKSKYGLSRSMKVLVDLLTVKMIRSFRSVPLRLFGGGGVIASLVGSMFMVVWVAAPLLQTGGPATTPSIVFAGVSLVWFSLAAFLVMLGLVAESAVGLINPVSHRRTIPLVHEIRS